ncbi:MAG: LON peptidase substrate-binding domain-containing protein [Pseudomonadota bacterium]
MHNPTSDHEPSQPLSIPLFPLPLVLFPGAWLPLRIFETRYLNMVRDCTSSGTSFGIVHMEPAETGRTARHAVIGTEAHIEDFSTLDDGLLGIECRGGSRFRIQRTFAREDGLLMAEIDWLAEEQRQAVAAEFGALQTLLQQIMQQKELPIDPQTDPAEASSLSMALAAILPMASAQAQVALEMHNPNQRLGYLLTLLQSGDDRMLQA